MNVIFQAIKAGDSLPDSDIPPGKSGHVKKIRKFAP